MKARNGATFTEALFPGYVFMETQNLERATIETLKKVNGFYHFLADNSAPQKLEGSDLTYYSTFRNNGEIMGISRARFDENQRIKIVDGPLLGFEGKIIRVNKRCHNNLGGPLAATSCLPGSAVPGLTIRSASSSVRSQSSLTPCGCLLRNPSIAYRLNSKATL